MAREVGAMEWQWQSSAIQTTEYNHHLRCLSPGLGSSLKWHQDKWSMGPPRAGVAHKLSGTIGCNLGSKNIPEGSHRNISVTTTGQPDSCSIYQQHGRHSVPPTDRSEYILGVVNVVADTKSRLIKDRTNWKLHPKLFQQINQIWGPLQVDLFASRLSTQMPCYFSWRPDPLAEATEAFSQR